MNIDIKNMTQEQLDDLKAQIEAHEAKKMPRKLAWKPKYYESCNVIGGYIGFHHPKWTGDFMGNGAYTQGNCFPTKELAEAELKRRQILHRIHEWIDDNDAERGGRFIVGDTNYIIEYAADSSKLFLSCHPKVITNPLIPCFSSSEKRAQCIEDIGEENIKLLFKRYEIVRGE